MDLSSNAGAAELTGMTYIKEVADQFLKVKAKLL